MQNFTYCNPTKIIFGKGQINTLTDQIPKEARILITYGGGSIKRNGVYDQVMAALKEHTIVEFPGIEPNPKYETLLKALDVIKAEKIDFILAVGGGSIIDGTKFLAAAAYVDGDPWHILEGKTAITKALPFGTVLTLPATGSEMNSGAVISKVAEPIKLAFGSPLLFPQFSILDPETTFTLPPKQTANGIIDTYIHTLEQYLTYPVNSPLQDRFAEGILQTLIEEAPIVRNNSKDYDARANIMWASTWGLNGWIGQGIASDWATHMLGHELTAKFGIDHGQTLAVVMPSVMNVKRKEKGDKILQYGERIFGITEGDRETRIDQTIEKTREFFESLGISTHLKDYNVEASDVDAIVRQLEEHGMTALGEHNDITLEQSREILEGAL